MDHRIEFTNGGADPNLSSKQATASLEEIQIIFKEQFCKFELYNKNRLDSIEKEISIIKHECFRFSENIITTGLEKNEGHEDLLTKPPKLRSSYCKKLFNQNSLPGVRNVAGKEMPMQHSLLWIFIHTAALVISTTFILDAYYSWQNSLVVQSLVYRNVKDIPFPAITICEPLLLKEEYIRFEILKRCMSLENETSWLCSEEELTVLRISNDIYPIEYDLISMNELDRNLMRKLFSPIFGYSTEYVLGDANRTINGIEYMKYINELAMKRVSIFRIYNTDFPDSHYRIVNLRNGSISPTLLLAQRQDLEDGIHICQTINGIWQGPQERKTRDVSQNVSSFDLRKLSVCSPTNMIEDICKADLLYSENHLEIEFDDANNIKSEPLDDLTPDVQTLYKAKQSFERYIVFTHSCFDHPSITNMHSQRLSRHTASVSIVRPTLINARKDLAEVDISKRNCIFSFERKLSLFEVYTQKNCILECQVNCTLSVCGCIPYKTAIFNSSFTICTKNETDDCISNSQFFYWFEFKDKRCQCDCPSDCVSLSYDVDLSPDGFSGKTTYQVTYESPDILSMFRYSVNSPGEFVAYSLGILGVFNGFSMMLVWEVLYGITLGLWTTVRNIQHTP